MADEPTKFHLATPEQAEEEEEHGILSRERRPGLGPASELLVDRVMMPATPRVATGHKTPKSPNRSQGRHVRYMRMAPVSSSTAPMMRDVLIGTTGTLNQPK